MIIKLLLDVMQNRNRGRLDIYRQTFDKLSYRCRFSNILFSMYLVRVFRAKTMKKCRITLQNIRQRAANTGKQVLYVHINSLLFHILLISNAIIFMACCLQSGSQEWTLTFVLSY